MMMNPELQRNIWLELNRHRLFIIPFIIVTVLMIAYLLAGKRVGLPFYYTSVWLYLIFVVFWGSRLAGESVTQEITDKTWDSQRMSSLSPWSLAWGKLLGSTLIAWYGGTFALIAMAYSYQTPTAVSMPVGKIIIFFVLIGVLSQVASFVINLIAIRKAATLTRSLSNLFLIALVLIMLFLVELLDNRFFYFINWYGQPYRLHDFLILSFLIFSIWSIVAAYRLMRSELQIKNPAFAWFIFIIFLAYYTAGFVNTNEPDYVYKLILVIFSVILVTAYLMLFAENKNPMLIKRLFYHLRHKQWRTVFESLPGWFINVVILILFLLVFFGFENKVVNFYGYNENFRAFIVATCLFLLRDIGIVLFLNLSSKRNRADVTAVIYGVILYYIVPLLFSVAKMDFALALFMPLESSYPLATVISALLQIILVYYLVYIRWQKFFKAVDVV